MSFPPVQGSNFPRIISSLSATRSTIEAEIIYDDLFALEREILIAAWFVLSTGHFLIGSRDSNRILNCTCSLMPLRCHSSFTGRARYLNGMCHASVLQLNDILCLVALEPKVRRRGVAFLESLPTGSYK